MSAIAEFGDKLASSITVKNPLDGKQAGEIKLEGKGVKQQQYAIDNAAFETLVASLADGTTFPLVQAAEAKFIDTKAERDALLAAAATQTTANFATGKFTPGISAGTDGADNVLKIAFIQGANPVATKAVPNPGWDLGLAVHSHH